MRTSINTRRVGLATLATTLVLGGSVAGAGTAYAEADYDLDRISGSDRYATSAQVAKAFGAANTVILASGESGSYPDALTANYLAGVENAPVLLTKENQTPDSVKAAIRDSGARNIIIVGGEGVISAEQEKALSQDYTVSRLSGSDRFGTAAAVIAEGGQAGGDTALLATGLNFPDALGAGPVAFAQDMPLAITRPGDMPDNVLAELKKAGITKVLVLGGEGAVGKAVVDELKTKGIETTQRFDGADRAETSTLLAEYVFDTFPAFSEVNVASGYVKGDGADALGGAALTGKQKRALLITKSNDTAGQAVLTFLGEHSDELSEGVIFGGAGALSEAVELAMEKAVLGAGAQIGNVLYDTPQEAIDAAKAGDTVTVFGKDNPGFTVNKEGLTVTGEAGATVTEAVQVLGVDDVTISGLTLTPSNVGGQVTAIYLDNAEDITITGNTVLGTANAGAGVINTTGGEAETAVIRNNTFRDLLQGVFANPSAEFTIDDNVFRNNTAASANDAASTITGNRFIGNDEGIGLGTAGSTITGNSFGDNDVYVKDYTTQADNYDLAKVITDNTFDNDVTVTQDGSAIVDKPQAQ